MPQKACKPNARKTTPKCLWHSTWLELQNNKTIAPSIFPCQGILPNTNALKLQRWWLTSCAWAGNKTTAD